MDLKLLIFIYNVTIIVLLLQVHNDTVVFNGISKSNSLYDTIFNYYEKIILLLNVSIKITGVCFFLFSQANETGNQSTLLPMLNFAHNLHRGEFSNLVRNIFYLCNLFNSYKILI